MTQDPIKVVVIDDNKNIRYIIKEILETEADIEICGEADTIAAAIAMIQSVQPDVIILDISLDEETGGIKILSEVSQLSPQTKTIILSAHDEHIYADQCLKSGAKGYICKDKAVRCLVQAIHEVYAGKEFVSSDQ